MTSVVVTAEGAPAGEHGALAAAERRLAIVVLAIVVLAIAALVLAVAIVSVDVWLGNDAPAHLFNAYAHAHIDDVDKGYGRYLEATWPLTSRGFVELFLMLEPLFGWRGAYRAVIVVIAELWAFGFCALVVAVRPARWPIGLIGFATALSWPLDMGFFPFCLAAALVFWTTAFWLRTQPALPSGAVRAPLWPLLVIALAMFVIARVHVFPAILGGVVLAVVEGARAPVGRRIRRLAALGLAGIPAIVVAALASAGKRELDVEQHWGAFAERLSNVAACTLSGPWWRSAPVVALALLSCALLWWRRRDASAADMALGGVGVVFCSLAVAMPLHLSWQFYGPRFAPIGLLLLVTALPFEQLGPRLKMLTTAALLAFAIAAAHWSASHHRTLDEIAAPAFALMTDAAPSSGRRLPIMLPTAADAHAGVRYGEPMRQLGQIAAIELGGISAYGYFMSRSVHTLALRPGAIDDLAPVPPQAWVDAIDLRPGPVRDAQLARIAHGAQRFDELFVFGSAADIELFIRAGYALMVPASASGGRAAMRARFRGCQGTIDVDGPPGSLVDLELGWWPLSTADMRFSGTIPAQGQLSFTVEAAGCGELWLRPCANGTEGVVRGAIRDGLRCTHVAGS